MIIYMDSCCYNRIFDDISQKRVRNEKKVISDIFSYCVSGKYSLVASNILDIEIARIKDLEKRQNVEEIYRKYTNIHIFFDKESKKRSNEIRSISNIKDFDSYHLACAQKANAEAFLTTDDRLIKMASKLDLGFQVINPVDFIKGGD